MTRRLGLLVNPVAGLGGRVGLKGSDGEAMVSEALRLGAQATAPRRATDALFELRGTGCEILTAAGTMGAESCHAAGLACVVVHDTQDRATSAMDTRTATRRCIEQGAELLLVASGDGTLRDIMSAVGDVPVLGIPAGVKMYSGAFAATPREAGRLAARLMRSRKPFELTSAEVLDADEQELRRDRPSTRLHGHVMSPRDPAVRHAKVFGSTNEDAGLQALCRIAAAELAPDTAHIFGPGSTMQKLMHAAGMEGTLLGVDVALNGAVIAKDASERQILAAIEGRPARIHVGIVGGTGCLFGRGNQQISAAVIAAVGVDNIRIIASPSKLTALGSQGLFVDTGDPAIDAALSGYRKVRTEPRREMVVRVQG